MNAFNLTLILTLTIVLSACSSNKKIRTLPVADSDEPTAVEEVEVYDFCTTTKFILSKAKGNFADIKKESEEFRDYEGRSSRVITQKTAIYGNEAGTAVKISSDGKYLVEAGFFVKAGGSFGKKTTEIKDRIAACLNLKPSFDYVDGEKWTFMTDDVRIDVWHRNKLYEIFLTFTNID
jgi:hypothetical protein